MGGLSGRVLATHAARLMHRLGRRGCFLAFLALVDVAVAYSLTPGSVEGAQGAPLYRYIARFLPLWAWAVVWVAVGAVCAAQALARHDHFAFTSAVALKLCWAALYLTGWLAGDVPRGWVASAVWAGFGGVTAIIASWPETRPLQLALHAAQEALERDRDGET